MTVSATTFVSTLQAALDKGQILDLPGGTLDVAQTMKFTLKATTQGWTGLRGGGLKINSRITDGSPVMVFEVAKDGIDFRYLALRDFGIFGTGKEGDGLTVRCDTNSSWIYSSVLRDVAVEHCGGNGIVLEGSFFESSLFDVWTHGNAHHGCVLQHKNGQVSAINVSGGGHRKNGQYGMATLNGSRDVKQFGVYYCENQGGGLLADQGFTLLSGCGFENNKGAGVKFQNFGTIIGCTGSTNGPQRYLLDGYLAGGDLTVISTGVEDYGQSGSKLAKLDGNGPVTARLIASGTAADVDKTPNVTVRDF